MTEEKKELLLKDLCARLSYGVKVSCIGDSNHVYNLELIDITDNEVYISTYEPCYSNKYTNTESIRPYLFPLSSMTEEQRKEYERIIYKSIELHCQRYYNVIDVDDFDCLMDFYHKYHFDYRGLIPLGLANNAVGIM